MGVILQSGFNRIAKINNPCENNIQVGCGLSMQVGRSNKFYPEDE
jgi:hypothetical protein